MLRLGLLSVLILPFGSHASASIGDASIGDAISSLKVTSDGIVITVPAAIVGGDDRIVERWKRAIEQAWNAGNDGGPFVLCDRPVRFEPVFERQAAVPAARNSHLVIVAPVRDGQRFISSVAYTLGTSPAYSPRAGSWASNMDAWTVVHEFGHLLGLLDEYVDDGAHRGHGEPGGVPRPDLVRYGDAWVSVMAVARGAVLARHVREIVRMHGGGDLLDCR